MLLITLLPFLAMYAAFGEVRKAADRLVVQQFVRYGALGESKLVRPGMEQAARWHGLEDLGARNPPNPHTAMIRSTRTSRMATKISDAGMVRRSGVIAGPLGGADVELTTLESGAGVV